VQARAVDKVILHVAVAANTVGLGVILALLAELQDAYDLPTSGLGLIAGASFVTSFFAYLGLSRFADRGHAKAMLMAGSLVGSAALVLTAFAQDLWLLVFARAMLGLAEGVFVPAARRVVLDWDPDRPGEVLGTIMAASVGGFLLGPVIGGLLAPRFGLEVPFLLPAVIMMAAVPVIARLRAPVPIPAEGESSFMGLLRNRLVVAGILFMCVDFLTFGVFDSMWSRLLTDAGATTEFIGLTFALVAVPMLLLTRVLGRLVDRRSPMSVAIPGVAVLLAGVSGYMWLGSPMLLAGAALLQGIGVAAVAPAGSALVAAGSPPDRIAQGQGLMEASGFAIAAAAALPSGVIYGAWGRGTLFGGMVGIGGLVAVAAWLVGRSGTARAAAA